MKLPREVDLQQAIVHGDVPDLTIVEVTGPQIKFGEDWFHTTNIIKRLSDFTFWQVVVNDHDIESVEQVFEHLEFVQKTVFKNTAPTTYSGGGGTFAIPAIQTIPFNQPIQTLGKTCSKCGISLSNMMGYCCQNYPCPTGLGGAHSSVVTTK